MKFLLPLPVFPTRILQSASDAETLLLRRAREGDREAIGLLFGRSQHKIFALAFQILRDREAAEDAAQEILLRAFHKMPQFRGESEFSTWLYRLALNYCLEQKRGLKRRNALLESNFEAPTPTANHAQRLETRLALEMALDSLPEELRLTLILREWHGLSYDEIALVLRVPVGTVRSRLHQARKRFQTIWEAHNAD
ncbi:RNA polymerase sigma-70 factor, ECF subfamily [Abditibacterium utsteinense]|uniref:RNA polymerase sigma-70 factor, ECF subfamily n=1 Tax=Abditibacterium utsteinense TaxID=1960156 RepID=A0A2S8SWM6_9BACT|nr:RNA polymerase sigma factor [Abditibacterium utsteinense]PQV65187.1 RNA polymerase sigma-70 factor, ECF subfamily [Abditibacterium utsteinense]